MDKFLKVERLPIGKQGQIGRHLMSQHEMHLLLTGKVVIEEKLNGKTVGTMQRPGHTIYGEYLALKHSIVYDALPAWIVAFDVYDHNAGRFLDRKAKLQVLETVGVPCVPLIYEGEIKTVDELIALLDRQSAFSTKSRIEGIVIKNYPIQLMGKVVSYEFLTGIEKHWTKSAIVRNKFRSPSTASPLALSLIGWNNA